MNILTLKVIKEITLKAEQSTKQRMQNKTSTTEIGHWTSDFNTFEQNLCRNTAPEEVYMLGNYSASQRHVPSCLMRNIEEFISCWTDAEMYDLNKVTLYNFHHLLSEGEVTKMTYPGVWKHFSHTGCVIIFNPNDIDFTVQLFQETEQYKLVAGGILFIETNAKFRYFTDEKSSKLKHMVVFSFGRRV
jgi:hypothetical protein